MTSQEHLDWKNPTFMVKGQVECDVIKMTKLLTSLVFIREKKWLNALWNVLQ